MSTGLSNAHVMMAAVVLPWIVLKKEGTQLSGSHKNFLTLALPLTLSLSLSLTLSHTKHFTPLCQISCLAFSISSAYIYVAIYIYIYMLSYIYIYVVFSYVVIYIRCLLSRLYAYLQDLERFKVFTRYACNLLHGTKVER